MSAFGHAMLDHLRTGQDTFFRISCAGAGYHMAPCSVFRAVPPAEQALIRQCSTGNAGLRVLDIGCGIGRHSRFLRGIAPGAMLSLVEIDPGLRNHAAADVGARAAYALLDDIPPGERFDLVFLLGNGLGIFGSEAATRAGLGWLRKHLAPDGVALIECGNPFHGEFFEASHQIQYEGVTDGPFPWGYASQPWLHRELRAAGLMPAGLTPSQAGGPFSITLARNQAPPPQRPAP